MARRLSLITLFPMIFAAIVAAMLISPPRITYACSCMVPPGPAQARNDSVAVFSGTVTAVEGDRDGMAPLRVSIDINQVWKGPMLARTLLLTSGSSASCGFEFQPGTDYLVYAYDQDGQLATGLCTRTAPLADAALDIAELGPGTAAAPSGYPAGEPQAAAGSNLPLIIGGAAGLAVLASAAALLLRRRSA
jgi:hypothetical protein